MKIKCLIVDDEPAAQRVVEKFLSNFQHAVISGSCKTAFEAINFLNNHRIDLLFLDINMPGLTGIDFLRSLRNPPVVIITTAYREYAVESYELDVVDYLHKPFSFDRFFQAFQKAEEKIKPSSSGASDNYEGVKASKDHFFIKADKKFVRVNYGELTYIESLGDYCKIHTEKSKVVAAITLKKLLEILPSTQFVRVHKSFIVAYDKIELVEGNTIKIGTSVVPIGYSYKKGFLKHIGE